MRILGLPKLPTNHDHDRVRFIMGLRKVDPIYIRSVRNSSLPLPPCPRCLFQRHRQCCWLVHNCSISPTRSYSPTQSWFCSAGIQSTDCRHGPSSPWLLLAHPSCTPLVYCTKTGGSSVKQPKWALYCLLSSKAKAWEASTCFVPS